MRACVVINVSTPPDLVDQEGRVAQAHRRRLTLDVGLQVTANTAADGDGEQRETTASSTWPVDAVRQKSRAGFFCWSHVFDLDRACICM